MGNNIITYVGRARKANSTGSLAMRVDKRLKANPGDMIEVTAKIISRLGDI